MGPHPWQDSVMQCTAPTSMKNTTHISNGPGNVGKSQTLHLIIYSPFQVHHDKMHVKQWLICQLVNTKKSFLIAFLVPKC